ncbi:SPOSA6832_01398, partial [Sporobolomyces salmonicolor]
MGPRHRSTSSSSPIPSTSSSSAPFSRYAVLPEYSSYHAELANHLLRGYTEALFADFTLHTSYADHTQGSFSLHAVVVSRSPVLRALLQPAFAASPRPSLLLPFADPSITPQALGLVLASLYNPSVLSLLTPENAPEVLATAAFLGLDYLAALAYESCESSLRKATDPEEIDAWVRFIEREKGPAGAYPAGSSGSNSPLVLPGSPALSSDFPPSANGKTDSASTPYEAKLRIGLLDRIVRLPAEMGAFVPATAAQNQPRLVDVLKRLPFELFKAAVEDSRFSVPSDMDRCRSRLPSYFSFLPPRFLLASTDAPLPLAHRIVNFAKRVVAARKQLALSTASLASTQPGLPAVPEPDFSEVVVLGFGSGAGGPGASAVNVLRKARKPALWKIGGSTY